MTGAGPGAERLLLFTDRRQAHRAAASAPAGPGTAGLGAAGADTALLAAVRAALAGGVRRVVLREKDLPRGRRLALAVALRGLLAPLGGELIVAGPDPLGGHAVHLSAADPGLRRGAADRGLRPGPGGVTAPARAGAVPGRGLPDPLLVGRSGHLTDDPGAVPGVDYLTLSPIFPTPSKPGYGPPCGLRGLAAWCARARVPVFALGGVTSPARAAACLAAGAYGVAVMGAVMRAPDPGAVAAALLAGLGAAKAGCRR